MKNNFNVGDIIIDKIVPSSRLLVLEKTEQGVKCLFLDGRLDGEKVLIIHPYTYKKVGEIKNIKPFGRFGDEGSYDD